MGAPSTCPVGSAKDTVSDGDLTHCTSCLTPTLTYPIVCLDWFVHGLSRPANCTWHSHSTAPPYNMTQLCACTKLNTLSSIFACQLEVHTRTEARRKRLFCFFLKKGSVINNCPHQVWSCWWIPLFVYYWTTSTKWQYHAAASKPMWCFIHTPLASLPLIYSSHNAERPCNQSLLLP